MFSPRFDHLEGLAPVSSLVPGVDGGSNSAVSPPMAFSDGSGTGTDPNPQPPVPPASGPPSDPGTPSNPAKPKPKPTLPPIGGFNPGDPGSGGPGNGDPGSGDPGNGDPGSGDPGSGDPGNGGPGFGPSGGGSTPGGGTPTPGPGSGGGQTPAGGQSPGTGGGQSPGGSAPASPTGTPSPPPGAIPPPGSGSPTGGNTPSGGNSPAGGGQPPAGPAGGNSSLPTVNILVHGKKDSDPTANYNYVQGEAFKATYAESNPPASAAVAGGTLISYQKILETWLYPKDAVKGYGHFQTINPGDPGGDPDGTYTKFIGDPDSAQNTVVEVQKDFTSDDMDHDFTQQNDHFIDTFFWGPQAVGAESVSLTVKYKELKNGVFDGNYVYARDIANLLQVTRPTGVINVTQFGTAGVGGGWLSFDKNYRVDNQTMGIKWTAKDTNISLPVGQIGVVQTVKFQIDRYYHTYFNNHLDEYRPPDKSLPGTVLDSDFPYWGTIGAIGVPLDENDSPGVQLTLPSWYINSTLDSVTLQDAFKTTLMYQPLGGIWVPVGSIGWSWGGSVSNSGGGVWSTAGLNQSLVPYGPAASNADFPVWSHNYTETKWTNIW